MVDSDGSSIVEIVVIVARIAIVICIWLFMFIGVFLGYLTIPLVMLAAFALVLAMPEIIKHYGKLILRRWRTLRRNDS